MLPADLRSWLGTLCRTKDREKSTLPAELSTYHSQVPKTQAQKNGERQNKPQFSSFSFIFPPQEVKGYGLCKNTASKLTIKISGTSNFPLGTSGTAFVFVLWVVPENNTEE